MATAADIDAVRRNTNEPTAEVFSDEAIGALVDAKGSAESAAAAIWAQKAASYAELVDVTEAGASHAMSDLYKNALAMEAHWKGVAESMGSTRASARVHKIVRS